MEDEVERGICESFLIEEEQGVIDEWVIKIKQKIDKYQQKLTLSHIFVEKYAKITGSELDFFKD